MTFTLLGRIQTRLALLATVGVAVTLVAAPFVPAEVFFRREWGQTVAGRYALSFSALAIVALAGTVWDVAYHGLQQFRWDKDWPSLFALLSGFSEGLAAWYLLEWIGPEPTSVRIRPNGFALLFGLIWLSVFFFAQGPMRVIRPRWRFQGGRLLDRNRS